MNGAKNADCTLFHKEWDAGTRQDIWTCTQYPGVSWYATEGATVGTSGDIAADKVIVRIYTTDPIAVAVGDMLVLGLVSADVTSSVQVSQRFACSYRVLAVRDNRRGRPPVQHWRLEGA